MSGPSSFVVFLDTTPEPSGPSFVVTLDTTAPELTWAAVPATADAGSSFDAEVALNEGTVVEAWGVLLDGRRENAAISGNRLTWTLPSDAPAGTMSLYARAMDDLLNEQVYSRSITVISTAPPAPPPVPPSPIPTYPGGGGVGRRSYRGDRRPLEVPEIEYLRIKVPGTVAGSRYVGATLDGSAAGDRLLRGALPGGAAGARRLSVTLEGTAGSFLPAVRRDDDDLLMML